MSGRSGRVVVALVLATVVAGLGVAWPASVQAGPDVIAIQAVEGLAVEGTTTYRLDEEAGVVRVRATVTLTNTRPPENLGYATRSYYFDEFAVGTLGPVAAPRVSRDGDGTSVAVRVEEPDSYVDVLVVDLSPDLTYGNPQHLVIEYDLPSQPNGSEAVTRVNGAFASWYVTAIGDDGAADVVLDIPDRFEMEAVTDASAQTTTADGRSVIRFDDLNAETGFFGVSVRDDDALVIRSTIVGESDFEIQAWPGDEAWASFAVDTVEDGIPALVEWIGLDAEDDREIIVAESGTPYLYGYGGWYSPADGRVEIGDKLDLHTMLHELAHIWYHGELFSSRWVTEGLADLAASRATEIMDEEPIALPPLDATRPGAQPLSQWDDVQPGQVSDADDLYGYQTSHALLTAITDLIGPDALRDLVARAEARDLPLAHPDDTVRRRIRDWRYFYDLLVTTPDLDIDALDALFDAYVWTDKDRTVIGARREAMESYERLAVAADGWTPPVLVRKSLADWQFEEVPAGIAASEPVAAARAEFDRILDGTGAEPTAVRDRYRRASTISDLTSLTAQLPAFTEAATALAHLDSRLDDLSPVHRLGALGRDLHTRQADAAAAFEAGDLENTHRIVRGVDDAVNQAPIAAVALVLLAVTWPTMIAVGVRIRRRSVARHSDVVPELAD